jgi:hypothetical protein
MQAGCGDVNAWSGMDAGAQAGVCQRAPRNSPPRVHRRHAARGGDVRRDTNFCDSLRHLQLPPCGPAAATAQPLSQTGALWLSRTNPLREVT